MNTVFVTNRQYNSMLKRIEKANLKAHGKSLSAGSMRGGDIIVEIQDDKNGMIVISEWREELKKRYLSL